MNNTSNYTPRQSNPDAEISSVPPERQFAPVDQEKKKIKGSIDNRKHAIVRYLDKFKFTNPNHMEWLKDNVIDYYRCELNMNKDVAGALHDADFKLCTSMVAWFKSKEGEVHIDEIKQSWAKCYSKEKANYSVAMPKLIFNHLKNLAKKNHSSMNSVVFNLIERAYAKEEKTSSFEENVLEQFNELKQLIVRQERESVDSPELSLEERIGLLTKEIEDIVSGQTQTNLNINYETVLSLSKAANRFLSHQQKALKGKA